MILALVPCLLHSHVARGDDKQRNGLSLQLYIAMRLTTMAEWPCEIVRDQNIDPQYFAQPLLAFALLNNTRTTARWDTERPTECLV
jgi:hypothetical protein